jgi:NTP pyrophosphatase (non-canonical NTP hydrolase)
MNTEYKIFQKNTEKNPFDLKYMAIGLAGEVGEVLNEIKKLERDDDNILTYERKSKIIEEMGDVMWYFTGILNRVDTTFETVLKTNMDKLK